MTTLMLGTGFIGDALAAAAHACGRPAVQSSRRPGVADVIVDHGPALDALLARADFGQIVVVGQLTAPDIDWVIERVDGPRWIVLSSSQLASSTRPPGADVAEVREELAIRRGACVLRPTMVYGHGRDRNVSRFVAFMKRWRFAPVVGGGRALVQPLHVDDLAALVAAHAERPCGGLFPVGGSEALPVRELVGELAEILGLRLPAIDVPAPGRHVRRLAGKLMGLRPDQISRLDAVKSVDTSAAACAFGWEPAPLGLRLEQAVREMHAGVSR